MRSSSILRNGLIYTIGNSLNALLPLVLVPFLTQELDNRDYARVASFQMIIFFLTPVLSLESISAIARAYFDKRVSLPAYITSSLIVAFFGLIFSILIIVLLYALSSIASSVEIEIIAAAVAYCIFMYPFNLVLAIMINKGQPVNYSFLAISAFLLNLFITLSMFHFLESSSFLRIYAQVVTALMLGLFCSYYLIRSNLVAASGNRKYVKDILVFSSPLVVHTLGGALLGMGPQLALIFFGAMESVSDYSIALQIGSAIGLISVGANKAVAPWLQYNYEISKDVLNKYTKLISLSWIVGIILFLFYMILEPVILDILNIFIDQRYFGYSIYLKWVVAGFLANGIYLLYVNVLVCRRQTLALASMSSLSGILGLGLSVLAISWFGVAFAGIGIAAAFGMLAVSVGIYASRKAET